MTNREKYQKMVTEDFDKYKIEMLENSREYLFDHSHCISDDREVYDILLTQLPMHQIDDKDCAELICLDLLRIGVDSLMVDTKSHYYDNLDDFNSNQDYFFENLMTYIGVQYDK